jgi:hypothetical protein
MKRMQPSPHRGERRSIRDLIAMAASITVGLATIVLLGDFVLRGATPPVIGLLAMTLGAQSLTLTSHSRGGERCPLCRHHRLNRMREWSRTRLP